MQNDVFDIKYMAYPKGDVTCALIKMRTVPLKLVKIEKVFSSIAVTTLTNTYYCELKHNCSYSPYAVCYNVRYTLCIPYTGTVHRNQLS